MVKAAACGTALLAAAPGMAVAAEQATFSFGFTTAAAGARTGLDAHVTYRDSDDPDGKAPALTAAAFAFPAGTRIDTGAVEQCVASDEELRALGRGACPEGSHLGEGVLVATTGLPADPVTADVTVFNGRDEIIELVTVQGTNQTAGFDRLTVEGSTLRAHPPATPGGPPDGRTTIREVRFRLAPSPVFTTPAECPGDGRWRATATFGFASGSSLQVPASVPCDAPGSAAAATGAGPAAGRFGVRATPRRLRRGRRARLRVRVLAGPACRRGVVVRRGRRTVRTDARGRAVLVVRPRRRGRLTIRVRRAGCGRAVVRVPVR
jgi:hypothetical protein